MPSFVEFNFPIFLCFTLLYCEKQGGILQNFAVTHKKIVTFQIFL